MRLLLFDDLLPLPSFCAVRNAFWGRQTLSKRNTVKYMNIYAFKVFTLKSRKYKMSCILIGRREIKVQRDGAQGNSLGNSFFSHTSGVSLPSETMWEGFPVGV